MAKYRKIDTRMWNDEKFRTLSSDAKLIFMFVMTHPSMTALGAMRATVPGMEAELGTLSKGFREGFQELVRKGLVECDEQASFIALKNFLKYNGPENPNVVKGWIGALDLIPECHLKYLVLQRARTCAEALGEAFSKVLPEPFRKGMPNPEQEPEPEPEQEPTADSPEADLPPSVPPKPRVVKRVEVSPDPPAETAMTFDCVGETKVWHLVQPQIDAWQLDYPNLDVPQEMRNAWNWSKANVSNRKTAKGMYLFLVSWLNRSTKQGGGGDGRSKQAGLFGGSERHDPTKVRTGDTATRISEARVKATAERLRSGAVVADKS